MSPELVVAVCGGVIALLGLFSFLFHRSRHIVRVSLFGKRWKELQKLCAQKDTWASAITEADSLLDRALKKRGYKGKTMGERLVSAEKSFTSIETLWAAHKLKNKLDSDQQTDLSLDEVKSALIAFRQGLRDLGVL